MMEVLNESSRPVKISNQRKYIRKSICYKYKHE